RVGAGASAEAPTSWSPRATHPLMALKSVPPGIPTDRADSNGTTARSGGALKPNAPSSPRLRADFDAHRNARDFIQLPGGDGHDEFVGLIIGRAEPATVDTEKRDRGGQGKSLIAVHE